MGDREGVGNIRIGKESEQEMRVFPVLASSIRISVWVVQSEAEYGACSAFFMDGADLGVNAETTVAGVGYRPESEY